MTDREPQPPAEEPSDESFDFEQSFDQLRAMARTAMRNERVDHTLQPTALVHEVYLRLTRDDSLAGKPESAWYAAAAVAIKRILIEHARRHSADRRGGGWLRVDLDNRLAAPVRVVDFAEAWQQFERLHPRQAKVAELRVFCKLKLAEIGAAVGKSLRTVEGDWAFARAFLARELEDQRA